MINVFKWKQELGTSQSDVSHVSDPWGNVDHGDSTSSVQDVPTFGEPKSRTDWRT